jgi:hypothetical protein
VKFSAMLRFCFTLIASQLLIGCGSSGNFTTPALPNTAALNGNWLLAGNQQARQYPSLSVALIVIGSQIYARGDMTVPCSNSPGGGVGGGLSLTGQINPDGSFHLGEVSYGGLPNGNSIQLSIDGSAPASGSRTWTGTYSFTDLAGYTSCIVNLTAPFTATALAPINATYAGTLPSGSSGSITVGSSLVQGASTTLPGSLGSVEAFLPLSGTITVSGSPCFTHGTSSAINGNSQIEGDISVLNFTMDDGSNVWLTGWLSSPDQSVMYPATLIVMGGNCNQNNYFGTLIRQ